MTDEYQMVASLLSMDVETMCTAAERDEKLALGLLQELKKRKDKLINDKKYREGRFNATQTIFNIKR